MSTASAEIVERGCHAGQWSKGHDQQSEATPQENNLHKGDGYLCPLFGMFR
jgi:hypothetical protein